VRPSLFYNHFKVEFSGLSSQIIRQLAYPITLEINIVFRLVSKIPGQHSLNIWMRVLKSSFPSGTTSELI